MQRVHPGVLAVVASLLGCGGDDVNNLSTYLKGKLPRRDVLEAAPAAPSSGLTAGGPSQGKDETDSLVRNFISAEMEAAFTELSAFDLNPVALVDESAAIDVPGLGAQTGRKFEFEASPGTPHSSLLLWELDAENYFWRIDVFTSPETSDLEGGTFLGPMDGSYPELVATNATGSRDRGFIRSGTADSFLNTIYIAEFDATTVGRTLYQESEDGTQPEDQRCTTSLFAAEIGDWEHKTSALVGTTGGTFGLVKRVWPDCGLDTAPNQFSASMWKADGSGVKWMGDGSVQECWDAAGLTLGYRELSGFGNFTGSCDTHAGTIFPVTLPASLAPLKAPSQDPANADGT